MQNKIDFPKEVFTKILDKHHLGAVINVCPLTGGYANPAFLVNNIYVIRFHQDKSLESFTGEHDRFTRESILYPLFSLKEIPAPQFIAINNEQDIFPYYYIIISFLSGKPMADAYPPLNEEGKVKIAVELGKVLRNIHETKEEDLKTHLRLFRTEINWKDTVIQEFNESYELFNNHRNHLDDNLRSRIEAIVHQFKQNISEKDIPIKLIHSDFHAHHVIINEDTISGIIDFEWSRFGDPLWDFQKLPINFSIDGEFLQSEFLNGYGIKKFAEKELLRFKMYCILQGIWQVDHTAHGDAGYPKELIGTGYTLIENAINYSKAE